MSDDLCFLSATELRERIGRRRGLAGRDHQRGACARRSAAARAELLHHAVRRRGDGAGEDAERQMMAGEPLGLLARHSRHRQGHRQHQGRADHLRRGSLQGQCAHRGRRRGGAACARKARS